MVEGFGHVFDTVGEKFARLGGGEVGFLCAAREGGWGPAFLRDEGEDGVEKFLLFGFHFFADLRENSFECGISLIADPSPRGNPAYHTLKGSAPRLPQGEGNISGLAGNVILCNPRRL